MLHLVGILFPHINDDARSKSHQISTDLLRLPQKFFLMQCNSQFLVMRTKMLHL